MKDIDDSSIEHLCHDSSDSSDGDYDEDRKKEASFKIELADSLPPRTTVVSEGLENQVQSDPLRKRGWHRHVHPKLHELTKNMREKNKTLNLNKGLEKAGMTLADLPTIDCEDDAEPPRRGVCYKFLLGNCDAGEDCHFCHVAPKDLSEEMVNTLVPPLRKLVKEGLEKVAGQKRKRSKGPAKVTFKK